MVLEVENTQSSFFEVRLVNSGKAEHWPAANFVECLIILNVDVTVLILPFFWDRMLGQDF